MSSKVRERKGLINVSDEREYEADLRTHPADSETSLMGLKLTRVAHRTERRVFIIFCSRASEVPLSPLSSDRSLSPRFDIVVGFFSQNESIMI